MPRSVLSNPRSVLDMIRKTEKMVETDTFRWYFNIVHMRQKTAREISIAGGDPLEASKDRGYKGKWNTAANEEDLDLILNMRKEMGEKPVIAILTLKNPMVMAEFEPYTDAILVEYGVTPAAVLDVLTGAFDPEGLLPIQIPKDMETVEQQKEDVAFDMECYEDSEGHTYDFGYGMNFGGVIRDERTKKYVK